VFRQTNIDTGGGGGVRLRGSRKLQKQC